MSQPFSDDNQPLFFAVKPLARNLLSQDDVLVYPYRSGKFIGDEEPIPNSHSGIDLTQLGYAFLFALESVLDPLSTGEFEHDWSSLPDFTTDAPDPRTSPYESILAAKVLLASAISKQVANVFETSDPLDGLDSAREFLRQQLLVDLRSASGMIVQYSGARNFLVPFGEQSATVPLRTYPTLPSLVEQTFVSHRLDVDGEDLLLSARSWSYCCHYAHARGPHDEIRVSVYLNVGPSGVWKDAPISGANPDLFAALVQFTSAYPQIATDLNQQPLKGNAISSFAWLAQRVADAWRDWPNDHDAPNTVPSAHHFSIVERAEVISGVNALVVSITANGSGLRLPRIELAGHKTRVLTETIDSASYYFLNEEDEQVLSCDRGRKINSRQLVLEGFKVAKIENASAELAVTRNKDLLPGRITSLEFVFRTPFVGFGSVVTPALDSDVEINIARCTPETPASLATFLSNLLRALFEEANSGDKNRTIALAISYSYGPTSLPQLPDAVVIPVLLINQLSIPISNEELSPDSGFVSDVSNSINDWLKTAKPEGVSTNGKLWFDLSLYASLTETQLPVARMRRLFLETKLLL